jgi:pimeloyl-ACP methyl ester carboxylesterase
VARPDRLGSDRAVRGARTELFEALLHTDLRSVVPALDIPTYVLAGAHDWTANTDLARHYLRRPEAPV